MAGIDPKYYYLTLALIALVTVVGGFVAVRLQREVAEESEPTTEKDLLGPLERAYYSGLMDEAEFRRIQESMKKQKEPADPPRRPLRVKRAADPEGDPAGED